MVVAVAGAGTIRAAAKRLGVSHATVSRHVRDLEARLSVRLFDRLKEGYVPTAAGEDVVRTAQRMDDEAAVLSRRIAGRDHALEGIIRVSVPAFLAQALLVPPLAEFRSLYPRVELQVVAGYEHVDLSKREADVAVGIHDKPPETLVGYRLADIAFAVYGVKPFVARAKRAQPMSVVVRGRRQREAEMVAGALGDRATHARQRSDPELRAHSRRGGGRALGVLHRRSGAGPLPSAGSLRGRVDRSLAPHPPRFAPDRAHSGVRRLPCRGDAPTSEPAGGKEDADGTRRDRRLRRPGYRPERTRSLARRGFGNVSANRTLFATHGASAPASSAIPSGTIT